MRTNLCVSKSIHKFIFPPKAVLEMLSLSLEELGTSHYGFDEPEFKVLLDRWYKENNIDLDMQTIQNWYAEFDWEEYQFIEVRRF
jgi:hypothetical protein